jgi:hypothetical protein
MEFPRRQYVFVFLLGLLFYHLMLHTIKKYVCMCLNGNLILIFCNQNETFINLNQHVVLDN